MRATLFALLFAASAAHAEIYTWFDASGARQMSNLAPTWYSSNEPSRVRTQVLVNGQLVDDTGLPQAEREKLQARRAKAESLGKPGAAAPAARAAAPAAAPPVAPVTAASPTGKPPPLPPPIDAADAAKSADGMKRAQEAQKLTDPMADQIKSASKPRP